MCTSTDDDGHTGGNVGNTGVAESGQVVVGEYRWEGLRLCVTGQCVAG